MNDEKQRSLKTLVLFLKFHHKSINDENRKKYIQNKF